ncbi:MAG: prepilin-type N-terminal cleavage/methylation domain-containing protein [Candidatus Gracilibacteria bacterium]|nr:prepilin-type N-terminal cleavage/methylation domain-containing protein [Candidatus Gracilibacteria bacterium]
MNYGNRRAFSFVEMLITVTILALISVIAYTSFGEKKDQSLNTQSQSQIKTLSNALLQAKQERGSLPLPKGNLNFFAIDTSYVHSYEDTETYGAHGFITNDTLPKKFIDIIPVDPRTGAFYAYGITKNSQMHEIAGITRVAGNPISYVEGDYTAETGPFNLIREYNGPNFVQDQSNTNFPYNPDEQILTASIGETSGTVTVNTTIYTSAQLQDLQLRSGDEVTVSSGGSAELFFSDGTRSVLGDQTQATSLTLQKMSYPTEDNLVTDIKLILQSGMIWNKAAKMDENSQFEIYTVDSTAAVRGTIFAVQKSGFDSNIVVQEGKVKVTNNQGIAIADLKTNITNNIVIPSTSISALTESEIIVPTGGVLEGRLVNANGDYSHTFNDSSIPDHVKEKVKGKTVDINKNIGFKLLSAEYDKAANDLALTFETRKKIFHSADYLSINEEKHVLTKDLISVDTGDMTIFTMTGGMNYNNTSNITLDYINTFSSNPDFTFQLSKSTSNGKKYSRPVSLTLIDGMNFQESDTVINDISQAIQENQNKKGHCNGFIFTNSLSKKQCAPANPELSEDWNLVAYAPYDTPGDLNLYKAGSGKYVVHSNAIIGNNTGLPDGCINPEVNKSNSFCETSDGKKGIFIDNEGSGGAADYLKYENVELVGDYVIEMEVKNISDPVTRSFFKINNYRSHLRSDNKISLKQSSFQIGTDILNNLYSDFNQFQFKKTGDLHELLYNKVQIFQNTKNENAGAGYLYIGGKDHTGLKTLNGIISYVKVYKK